MVEIELKVLLDFFVFLTVPFLFALGTKKVNLPPVLGYILGGIFFGNFLGSFSNQEAIKSFAYFGILLLLFTVGLETNFSRLISYKKIIFIAGSLQILLSIFFTFLVSLIFKFSFLTSFLIGIALSSSSTGIVAKIIQDRGEESSFLGEMAMGILIFQDISFIPFLIIFTSITNGEAGFFKIFSEVFIGLVKSTIIVFLLFYFGQKIIPIFFNKIGKLSRELLNLFIIIFIFFIAGLSYILGIPSLIGIFIAGVFLAQTLEHHHIFSEIRPLRDILSVIFFIYIGYNAKILENLNLLPSIFLFTFLIILVKFLVIFLIFTYLKFHTKLSFSLASYLFQIDEDAFILMSTAYLNKLINQNDYVYIISSVIITLIITPIIIKNKDFIYENIKYFVKKYLPFLDNYLKFKIDSNLSPIDQLNLKNHVVICGYGRIGSNIGKSLILANIPFIAIDYNLGLVERARRQGVNIIYGDPTDIDILDYAEVDEATILILAIPNLETQKTVYLNAKKLNKNIYVISRIHKEEHQNIMKDLGVNLVVQPEFEASISIIKKIYLMRQLDKIEIINKLKRLKIEQGYL